ncbi:mitochondrial amidoxime reducing component 2-like [Anthonomus grandis grandis]|uniref:mitochondrial amidoxime reducing component 2-like n=1 Tax=Anthonomus grandis grandis TaxID=2921223 RepID=UPI002166B3AC|nr:mitochondrial amidoxime reducing component 2-like [Anthonomus grandis grandis]
MAPVLSTITSQVAIGVGTIAITIISGLILKKMLREKVPQEWQQIGTITKLYIYPLKSAKGIEYDTLVVTEKGVTEPKKNDSSLTLRDRSFVMYKPDVKEIRTARQLPKAFLIEIRAAERGVILSAPNQNDIYISIPEVQNNVAVTFGKEVFICTDCGDAVAKWLSNYLLGEDKGLRLGYGNGSVKRDIRSSNQKLADYYTNMDNKMAGIFSDLAALHVVNQATIDDLNHHLPDDQQITFNNFRPNILIEGPEKFAEDDWLYVKFGEVITKVGLECLRCIETTISSDGVMNKERQPLKMLEQYRRTKGPFSNGVMGAYLRVLKTGVIHKGDPVYIPKTL